MSALVWVGITLSRSDKFMVKGTSLNVAKYGKFGRFRIYEVRCYDADNNADRQYRIADASGVSDADVRKGISAPIVATLPTEAEAVAFCDRLEAA